MNGRALLGITLPALVLLACDRAAERRVPAASTPAAHPHITVDDLKADPSGSTPTGVALALRADQSDGTKPRGPVVVGTNDADNSETIKTASGFDPWDLESICRGLSAGANPWFGRRPLADAERKCDELQPADASVDAVFQRRELGFHFLRLNQADKAVEFLRAAWRAIRDVPGRSRETDGLLLELAVAEIRLGENQNCIEQHCRGSCIFPIHGDGVHRRRGPSRAAAEHLAEYLGRGEHPPSEHFTAIWLLNLAHMTLGTWPDGVPEKFRLAPKLFESQSTAPRFVDVAPALGLTALNNSGGAVVDDLDGDGRLDVAVSSADPCVPLRLYHNRGDGTLVDHTESAGLSAQLGGLNLLQADYDNDGRIDLLVLRGAWMADDGRQRCSLLRNTGGRFEDVTQSAGLAARPLPTQAATWFDYDLDGDLDLYMGGETGVAPQFGRAATGDVNNPCALYRNNGDGTFTDVAAAARVTNDRFTKAVAAGDYDNDGRPDLYVSNLGQPNRLYRNRGDGTFAETTDAAGVAEPIYSFPTFFFDFDNDGWLDLFVGAYEGDVGMLCAEYLGHGRRVRAARMRLYHNQRDGTFRNIAESAGLHRLAFAMAASFGDIDNDGRLDIHLGTGAPSFESLVPDLLFRNLGDGRFADVTTAAGVGHLQKGHAIAYADIDDDGDQDVFHQIGGFFPGDRYTNALFLNPGGGGNWITIRLVGARDNRFGVGARIKLTVRDGGAEREIHATAGTGGSFGGSSLRQEIGVGAATRIESLEVRWPATGETQRLVDVPVNRMIELRQGSIGHSNITLKPIVLAP